uniref:Type I site-specific deoxyribonuclease n=1 Tax=Loa loa TaxID=7209 RepID=A0A1I7VAK2_LOALO
MEWLNGRKSDIEKQVIVLDDIISKANDLEIEWKELLRPANDGEWENNVALYELQKNAPYCERASLLTKLNRISETIIEVKMKYGKADHDAAPTGEQKSPEDLIEKIITTSKLPTLKPVGFDGDPRMWGQFISEFEESIHKRTDLAPTEKFMHLLSSLKAEAREQISDFMVNEENHPLALENLYERYGDKK